MSDNTHIEYFQFTRKEIINLLPEKIDKVLEIGCGEGQTLEWLRSIKGCKWIGGVELCHDAARIAKSKLDQCYEGNIETITIPIKNNTLDVILCLDVLEHLVDPWAIIKKLYGLLKPGGCLISSIPNVRHYTVSLPYFFKGTWNYENAGILDKTHLRFFVKKTAIELIESSGLKVVATLNTFHRGKIESYLVKILPQYFKRFFEYQYLIKAIKNIDKKISAETL